MSSSALTTPTTLPDLRQQPLRLGEPTDFAIKLWLNTAKRQLDSANKNWEQGSQAGPTLGGKKVEAAFIQFKEVGQCLMNVMRHPKFQSMMQERDARGQPGPDLVTYNQLKAAMPTVSQTNTKVVEFLEKRDAVLIQQGALVSPPSSGNVLDGPPASNGVHGTNGYTMLINGGGSSPPSESVDAIIDGYTKPSPDSPSTPTFTSLSTPPEPATASIHDRLARLRQAGMKTATIDPPTSPKSTLTSLRPPPKVPTKPEGLQVSRSPPGSPRTRKKGDLVEDSAGERSGSAPAVIPLSEQQREEDWGKAKGSWTSSGMNGTSTIGFPADSQAEKQRREQLSSFPSPSTEFDQAFPSLDDLESRGFPDGASTQTSANLVGYAFPDAPTGAPASPPVVRRSLPTVPKPPHDDFDRADGTKLDGARALASSSGKPPLPTPQRTNPLATTIRPSAVPLSPTQSHSTLNQPSQPPSSVGKPESNSSFKIPFSTEVLPKHLYEYLATAFGAAATKTPRVLLLDVRSRDDYTKARIFGETVCIEPIMLRNGITSEGIENSMSMSPPAEAALFAARDRYDMVVIYDRASTSIPTSTPPSTGSEAQRILWNLTNAIYEREFQKNLQRQPVLLKGGWEAWERVVGEKGIVSDRGIPRGSEVPVGAEGDQDGGLGLTRSDAMKVSNRRAVVAPNGSQPSLRNGGSVVPLVPTFPSSPAAATGSSSGYFSPLSSYGSTYGGNGGIVPTQLALPPTAAARPGAPATYEYSSLNQSQNSYRPAYTQPHINGLASPPLNTASPSVPNGGFQRTRSDYGDLPPSQQSYSPSYNGSPRASIDYPQLRAPVASQMTRPFPMPSVQPLLVPAVPLTRPPAVQPAPLRSSSSFSTSTMAPYAGGHTSVASYLKFGDEAIGLTGLKNLGNTCYMNSTIQCLSATIPFARYFKEGGFKRDINMTNPLGTKGALSTAVAELIRAIWAQNYMFLSPNTFRENICRFAPQFRGSDQHDAQEFLGFLLDGLHEDLNYVVHKPKPIEMTPDREHDLETLPQQVMSEREWDIYTRRNDSFVVRYFQGQFRNQLKCMTCHKTSTTYNTFMPLSVPIPAVKGNAKVSLQECIEAFVREEILDKDDAWNCPRCKVRRKASKRLTLSRLPPILIIHLKRFSFKGPFSDKLETRVQYPLNGLDLTNYLPPPIFDKRAPTMTSPPKGYVYDLYGVTNHYGNLSSGHYTAYVRNHQEWNNIGDSKVTLIDPQVVQEGKQAYILFYRLRMA